MIQLVLHLIGDYVTQSDWMAQNKTKSTWAAFCHATIYALPFLAIASMHAWLVIWGTHLLIDRFRLARYIVWAKNFLAPRHTFVIERVEQGDSAKLHKIRTEWWHQWRDCSGTGYHKDSPPWLSVWLMIAADNTLHLAINAAAITWL